jgi:hypothetical protein
MLKEKSLETGLEGAVFDVEESLHVDPGSCALSRALPSMAVAHLIHYMEGVEDTFDG